MAPLIADLPIRNPLFKKLCRIGIYRKSIQRFCDWIRRVFFLQDLKYRAVNTCGLWAVERRSVRGEETCAKTDFSSRKLSLIRIHNPACKLTRDHLPAAIESIVCSLY